MAGLMVTGLSATWLNVTRLKVAGLAASALAIGGFVLTAATLDDLVPPPESLQSIAAAASVPRILDRHGAPLNVTLENDWNVHDIVPLHEIPGFLKRAFIHAEDKRFHRHGGPDWIARAAALRTNLASGRTVRGGSTITEQVVRVLHPRPRTLWARWLEGFEAARLQAAFTRRTRSSSSTLNQVPYAANRRGVRQAADYYFSRDLDTLSRKEMLALAVLVRSPSRLDLYRSGEAVDATIRRLADLMVVRGELAPAERELLLDEEINLRKPRIARIGAALREFRQVGDSQPARRRVRGRRRRSTRDCSAPCRTCSIGGSPTQARSGPSTAPSSWSTTARGRCWHGWSAGAGIRRDRAPTSMP